MDYLIWSFRRKAWWGPGYTGYVTDVEMAGRYNARAAGEIAVNGPDTVVIHQHLAELYGPPSVTSLWGDKVRYNT